MWKGQKIGQKGEKTMDLGYLAWEIHLLEIFLLLLGSRTQCFGTIKGHG